MSNLSNLEREIQAIEEKIKVLQAQRMILKNKFNNKVKHEQRVQNKETEEQRSSPKIDCFNLTK